jgi:hypothetical protein
MFAPAVNLRQARRFASLPNTLDRVSGLEIGLLLVCGSLAALAVGMLNLPFRVPGHAILRAVFPMAAGLALVPRRSAGLVMTTGAILTTIAMQLGGVGGLQVAAVTGLITLGPLLDWATAGKVMGWKLYARFVAAGAVANFVSFAVRFAVAKLGWESSVGHSFMSFWSIALASFVLCGGLAGFLSAAVWFRLRVTDDLRRP